jgi:hypothetical protein
VLESLGPHTHAPQTDSVLSAQEMFSLLNKLFCSQVDGAHCVKSDTSEESEAKMIGDSDPAIEVCVPSKPFHFFKPGLGHASCEFAIMLFVLLGNHHVVLRIQGDTGTRVHCCSDLPEKQPRLHATCKLFLRQLATGRALAGFGQGTKSREGGA